MNATLTKISKVFPKAIPNGELANRLSKALGGSNAKFNQFQTSNTLLASSLCCDELSRPLEISLAQIYGAHFSMGGLAGFPFGGVTAFGAMAAHIPDGGNCLVVYGPHVGVDLQGNVGTVERRGRQHGGSCCGSAVAASGSVQAQYKDKENITPSSSDVFMDPTESQQRYVTQMLLPYAERLENAEDRMVELPYSLYDAQDEMMGKIIEKGAASVASPGQIALLGGIQINTPESMEDHFMPMRLEIRDNKGQIIASILDDL